MYGGEERRIQGFGGGEGKRPLGRPRCNWEDNIKIDLPEAECGVWTGSSWLRMRAAGRHL